MASWEKREEQGESGGTKEQAHDFSGSGCMYESHVLLNPDFGAKHHWGS